jgi:hypothetical protein
MPGKFPRKQSDRGKNQFRRFLLTSDWLKHARIFLASVSFTEGTTYVQLSDFSVVGLSLSDKDAT